MLGSSVSVGQATTLTSLKSAVDSTLQPYLTLLGQNLGNTGLLASLPLHQFYTMSAVANEAGLAEVGADGQPIAQRKLDQKHAAKLALYILRGLLETLYKQYVADGTAIPPELDRIRRDLGRQPYFALQPIVVNIRTAGREGANLKVEQLADGAVRAYLSNRDTFWVVDGQHRRFAMDLMFEFLDRILKQHVYPKRGPESLYRPGESDDVTAVELHLWSQVFEIARRCSVVVDVHLGLDPDQERQLFHDLNNLGKRVEASLAFEFDESNPINLFIKEELIEKAILDCQVVDRDVNDWHNDNGVIARKDLVAVNARLLLNKTTVSGAKPQEVVNKLDVAKEFWEAVSNIPGFGQPGAKKTTVAAQPVVLLALAKLAYDFKFGRDGDDALFDRLLQGLEDVDFSHQNPMWRFYELTDVERQAKGLGSLGAFLPSDDKGANRDIGGWDAKENVMRFGSKRNDIYPILGDMIRWKLQLPNRHKRSAEAVAA